MRAHEWSDRAGARAAGARAAGALVAGALAGVVAAAPARAQSEPCDPAVLEETLGGAGSPAAVRAALFERAVTIGIDAVVDSLAGAWRTFPPDAGVPDALRARFASELDALRRALHDVHAATGAARTALAVQRVSPTQFLPKTSPSGAGFVLFDTDLGALSAPARTVVCTRAVLLWSVSDAVLKDARALAASRYARFATEWRNYERATPTQYPWELVLNGFVPRRSLAPRRWQLVALHPSAAGEAIFGDSISLRDVAVMEWGGVVVSWGGFRHSLGASGITGLRRSAPAATGALLRYGRTLALGPLTWRQEEGGRRRWSTVMTVDLYRLILGAPGELKDAAATAAARAGDATAAALGARAR